MTKEIPLTQGKFAIVDDDMYDYLNQWRWMAARMASGRWYAVRSEGRRPFRKTIRMHRVVIGAPPEIDVDHRNQEETLNNCRSNLRLCTQSQNSANVGKRPNNTSGYKGVFWDSEHENWRSTIMVKGKRIHVGNFPTPEEAAKEYDRATLFYNGEFAKTNFDIGNYR